MKDMQIICYQRTSDLYYNQAYEQGRHAIAEGSLLVEIHSRVCCGPLNLLTQTSKVPHKAVTFRPHSRHFPHGNNGSSSH